MSEGGSKPLDGRAQRSTRTQAVITKAVYDLVRAQSRFPTVLEVARHAGVGERLSLIHI